MRRNRWRSLLVRALVLVLVAQVVLPISAVSAPSTETSSPVSVESTTPGEWQEDLSERSAYRKVFRKDDMAREVLSIAPMHQPDSLDQWAEVDSNLVPDGDGFAYRNKHGAMTVRFTDTAAGNRFRFEHKGRSVTFDLPEHAFGGSAQLRGRATANQMRYEAPGSPVRVDYEVGTAGLFEDIWLLRAGAPHEFRFMFAVEGVSPELQADGSIWFVYDDSITERAFYIPAPFAEDAKGEQVAAATELQALGNGKWMLKMSVDPKWLRASERAWPIRLDPDLLADLDGGQWLEVHSDNTSWSDQRYLEVTPSSYSVKRTAHMQFNLRDYLKTQGKQVASATLNISFIKNGTYACNANCGATMQLAMEEQEWFQAHATWSRPRWQNSSWAGGDPLGTPRTLTFGSNYWESSDGTVTTVTYYFDVTEEVRSWLNGTVPNNGFYLYNSSTRLRMVAPTWYATGSLKADASSLEIGYTSVDAPTVSVGAANPASPSVTVSGVASLTKTEIYVDGVLAGTNNATVAGTFSFSLDTKKFPYGTHRLMGRTYTNAGQVVDSPVVLATFGDGGVTPPANLNVLPAPGGGMKLIWGKSLATNPSRTISYTIERSADAAFSSPITVASGVSATTYSDTGATGTPYYRVKAVTSAGAASVYTPATGPVAPVRPFSLRYQHMAGGGIQLRWSASPTAYEDSTPNLVTYTAYRNGSAIASGLTATTYTDTAVAAGTTYTYHVVAVNAAGQTSVSSDQLAAKAMGSYAGPEAPTQVNALPERNGFISLNWTPLNDSAVTYEIVRLTGSDPWADPGAQTPIAAGVKTWFWTDSSALTIGQPYWYRVRATKNGAVGPWSGPVGALATSALRNGFDSRQVFLEAGFGGNGAAVNLSNGNLTLTAVESAIAVPYLPQVISRTYNTNECGACTILGPGWRLNAEWRIEEGVNGGVVLVEGDGTEHLFAWDGSAYQSEQWYYGTLVRNAGTGEWTLSFPDVTRLLFTTEGKLHTIQERNGNELRYGYDASGRLTSISSYPVSRTATLAYFGDGRLQSLTDSAGRTTSYEYDSAGRLSRVVNSGQEETRYEYDEQNRLIRVRDAVGRWNYVAYGVNGGVSHLVNGLGQATSISTNTAGSTVVRDPLGNATTYALNNQGWLTGITDALGSTNTMAYVFSGNTLSTLAVTNPRGLITTYTYDSAGRATQASDSAAANAETNDLVAPGVASRVSTAAYNATTGDLTEQAAQVSGTLYHGSTATYSYTGTGSFPYRLASLTTRAYTQSNGGAKTPVGGTVTYTYDSAANHPGWVTSIKDVNGNITDLTYNETGTVQSVTNRDIDADLVAAGAVATSRDVVQEFTYHADGQIKDVVDWHLVGTTGTAITHYDYDALGRPIRVAGPDGSATFTMYDPSGVPALTMDAAGRVHTIQYDRAYQTVSVTQPDGGITAYSYDAAGRNVSITDPLSQTAQIQYDPLHRVTRAIDPNNMAAGWSYDKVGNITAISTGSPARLDQNLGHTVRASYYLSNLVQSQKEPVPTTAITLPAGVSLPPTEPGDPSGTTYKVTRYEYNLLGQALDQYDGNGYHTGYGYDDLDRLATVTQYRSSGNLVTRYGYDYSGNRTTVTDARGKVTSYRYDGLNRMWRQVNPLSVVDLEYRFDDAGNVSQKIEPRVFKGTAATAYTNYTYDPAHRLMHTGYTRSATTENKTPDVTYVYDGAGRRVYMWNGYGPTFYAYDTMGRLSEERSIETLVSYSYDTLSRLTGVTSHLGTTQYGYDNGSRLSSVQDPFGNQTWYYYDSNYGHLARVTLPLGSPNTLSREDSYHQLSDGRPTGMLKERTYNKTIGTTTTQVWKGNFTFDLAGMIRTFTDTTPLSQSYQYDEAYRLTQADGASGNSSHPNDRYTHDNAGNRITWGNELLSSVIYDYVGSEKWKITQTTDDANRVTQIDEVVSTSKSVIKTFEYEPNGNTTVEYWARTGSAGVCGFSDFPDRNITTHHDDANRLAERFVTDLTTNTNRQNKTTFTYDGDGRRLTQLYQQTDFSSSTCSPLPVTSYFTRYEYANGEVLNERTAGDAPVWYIRDPQGGLLYTLHWRNGELKPDAYVLDHLGSVRMVLDYAGSTANTYKYDAYGEITAKSGTLRNAYAFTGYAHDEYTGMYYAKARYYRPDLGRFTSQDTYTGSAWQPWTQHLYAYVGNNPVNYIDPTGHARILVADVGGGGAASDQTMAEVLMEYEMEEAGEFSSYVAAADLGLSKEAVDAAGAQVFDKEQRKIARLRGECVLGERELAATWGDTGTRGLGCQLVMSAVFRDGDGVDLSSANFVDVMDTVEFGTSGFTRALKLPKPDSSSLDIKAAIMPPNPKSGKTADITRWARQMGLETREGGNHTTVIDPHTGRVVTQIPRHKTIKEGLARDIIKRIQNWAAGK